MLPGCVDASSEAEALHLGQAIVDLASGAAMLEFAAGLLQRVYLRRVLRAGGCGGCPRLKG